MIQNKKTPIISVIIPVYNTAKYLAACLDSVIHQTLSDIEIICVNDESPDNSLQILEQYASRDKRIKIINQKNTGVIAARNNGISAACGEYVLCLDSDDKIAPSCLEKLYNTLVNEHCDLALPGVAVFGAMSNPVDLGEPTARSMSERNRIYSTCGLYKKDLWKKYGGYDPRFAKGIEDYDFWMNFFQDNRRVVKVPEILFFYNVKPAKESRNLQTIRNHKKLLRLMMRKYPIMRKYRRKKNIYYATNINNYLRVLYIFKIPFVVPRNCLFHQIKRTITRPFNLMRFANYAMNQQQLWKKTFVPLSNKHYSPKPNDPKIIAYYLPQYYTFPQNDAWHGRGFTEWTNTTRATPQFIGHYQPHLPIDVGFYNLDTTNVMHRQVELAKQYGIYGFCYYYYWFHGTKLMDRPIKNMLNDKSIDMPFCLFWANEDWTNTWGDAAEQGTKTYNAETSPDEAEQFLDDILPYWSDSRYIKIDGRPVLMIYKFYRYMLPEFITRLRQICHNRGIPEPYIMTFNNHMVNWHPNTYGADAAAEFNIIMGGPMPPASTDWRVLNKSAKLTKYNIEKWITTQQYMYTVDYPLCRGCFTNFDNTARKIYTGAWHMPITPELYYSWLQTIVTWTRANDAPGKFVFVCAWNEWAEGCHLEPDQKYGYAYLEMTRRALENS